MNGSGTIDTTLTNPDYKGYKNRGGGTANHGNCWCQYQLYCPGKGINLKYDGTRCSEFKQKCPLYPKPQRGATYHDEKGGSEALNYRWMHWIGSDGKW